MRGAGGGVHRRAVERGGGGGEGTRAGGRGGEKQIKIKYELK